MSGASWIQQPLEVDALSGEIDYVMNSCLTGGSAPGLTLSVLVDGTEYGTVYAAPGGFGLHTLPISFPKSLFEAGVARSRTLTVSAKNACTYAGDSITVHSVKIDAFAVR
jgi:hypothetical protein